MPAYAENDSLEFVGTATTVIRLGGFTILTDPNFLHRGQRAYLGRGLWSRRLTEPSMQPADLPPLDAVVLSHLHGDHFDRVARRELTREPPVLTTPSAAARLRGWQFGALGLETWQRHTLEKGEEHLEVRSLPGIHARGALGRLLPPVMGSMLEHRVRGEVRRRVYLSGDTLTGDHLDEVSRQYPRIDAAVVHLGGTRIMFQTVTMDAGQGVDFLQRIRPQIAVPVHHDDYRVFRDRLPHFLHQARQAGFADRLRPVDRGAVVSLDPAT